MSNLSLMTSMAMSEAVQGNYNSYQHQAMASANEQNNGKKEQELRKAAEGFEAIFIQKMWEEMRASVPENAYLSSKEEKYWQSMYNQELGKSIAKSGGIGLANLVVDQMTKERVKSPSTNHLSKADTNNTNMANAQTTQNHNVFGRNRMEVSPAPLFTEEKVEQNEKVAQHIGQQNVGQQKANSQNVGQQNINSQNLGQIDGKQQNNSRNLYENYENELEIKNANHINSSVNATNANLLNNSANVNLQTNSLQNNLSKVNLEMESQMGEGYEISMLLSKQNKNLPVNNAQNSPVVNQTLAELQNMAIANEPIVTKTTYITNLPASQRQNSILDNKGQITAEHLKQIEEKKKLQNQQINTELQNNQAKINENNHANPNEYSDYPEELINNNALTSQNNVQNNADKNSENKVETSQANILDGIQTTYRRQMPLYIDRQQLIASANLQSIYPTKEQVQKEIDKLLGKKVQEEPEMQVAQVQQQIQQETQPKQANPLPQMLVAQNTEPQTILTQTNMSQNTAPKHSLSSRAMGGPTFADPLEALEQDVLVQNVSATSPKLNIQIPLDGEWQSSFGWRIDPFTKERAWHTGVDIQAKQGSPIQAAANGTVTFAGFDQDLGNMIILDHGNGMQSVYGHNSELLVQKGEKISVGTNIAEVGMSGMATGPHLHFEIRDKGLSINPEPYLFRQKV